MWLDASYIHSAQIHLPIFFFVSPSVYLEASAHNDQLQSMTSLEIFLWIKFYVARRTFISSLTVSYLCCTTPRLVCCMDFFPLRPNGGHCSLQLNNNIVNVLNISIGATLAALTQQLLMRW
jgi:hypothetical protein